jgi:hypothetical protein
MRLSPGLLDDAEPRPVTKLQELPEISLKHFKILSEKKSL